MLLVLAVNKTKTKCYYYLLVMERLWLLCLHVSAEVHVPKNCALVGAGKDFFVHKFQGFFWLLNIVKQPVYTRMP